MAGGGAGGWAMSLTQELSQESGTESGTDSGLVAFDSIPENSRILHFGTSEEAQCILERVCTSQAGYCTDSPQTGGNTLLI